MAEKPAVVSAEAPAADAHAKTVWTSNWFSWSALALQVAVIILFGTCTKFESHISASGDHVVSAAWAHRRTPS